MRIPELVVPAGNLSKLKIAALYGADAIYVGAAGYSMRPDEASFSVEGLKQAVACAHEHGKQLYVAVNTLMSDADLASFQDWLSQTRDLPFDALIVSDAGAFELVRQERPELRIHISTQVSTANSGAAAFWKRAGAERVVLARECSLEQAATIVRDGATEVEVFVHGAMCVAVSGRCLLSAHLCGHSGSKGDCKHSCRWEWQLVEQKRPGMALTAFETGHETILMGSTDLCLIEHMPQLVGSGVHALKIEGRMKSEHYVAVVTAVYRAALNAYVEDPGAYVVDPAWSRELDAVSHRPYATGFVNGYPSDSPQSLQTHNWPVGTYEIIGVVEPVAEGRYSLMVKNPFVIDEALEWMGPGMTGGKVVVSAIRDAAGKTLTSTHPATTVMLAFGKADSLPEGAMLRRKRKHA